MAYVNTWVLAPSGAGLGLDRLVALACALSLLGVPAPLPLEWLCRAWPFLAVLGLGWELRVLRRGAGDAVLDGVGVLCVLLQGQA